MTERSRTAVLLGLVAIICSCQAEKPTDLTSAPDPISSGQEETAMSDPYAGATAISKDGVIIFYLRGDEIVKDGAVVGNFDGDQVRKDGSIVGDIEGDVFRHEGREVWKLDKRATSTLERRFASEVRSSATSVRMGRSGETDHHGEQ